MRKVGGRIGAVVDDVRLDGDIDPETLARHYLDDDQQVAFAELLGPLTT